MFRHIFSSSKFAFVCKKSTGIGLLAQTSRNNRHSMVVDPWGAIIAQCSEREGFFKCNLKYLCFVGTRTKRRPAIKAPNHKDANLCIKAIFI
jgi:predicted amidohydrolase